MSDMDFRQRLDATLESFRDNFNLSQLIVTILSLPRFETHPVVLDLLLNADDIVHAFFLHKSSHSKILDWANDIIRELVKVENGWHFSALHAKAEQIETFCIGEMAMEIEAGAPRLWGLLDRKVVVISILKKSTNQKANSLSGLLGIFLHSTHAPEKVIESMARMGLSISVDAIHDAIRSLSAQSHRALQSLGQSLLAAYAYDNFNINLKSTVPTAQKSADTLKHLTSGLLFPLQHGVTSDDLKCSYELWRKSRINPQIRDPDVIDQIPVIKTPVVAASAMDVNNSTVAGNIQAIEKLMAQGGVLDPDDVEEGETPDISEHVVLVHGDLGTGEQILSLQQRRAIEETPWRRFQHIIFVPGLFHLKMAAADAIWRALIQPMSARHDETCLMHDIAQLRPRETGIFGSKPGFRRMHQLIGHDGICRRLDCWQVEVSRMHPTCKTLEGYAQMKPTFDDLKNIAERLAREYVGNYKLRRARRQPNERRDMQYENSLLINKYFLLYEELSHAMNTGDIGRVETCTVAWALIFKATGKHKYATFMTDFLINVHFVYPEGLSRAIRYHWLINPTGKSGRFRAVDWCVELNNLFIKVKNGGTGSNRSVACVILESPLVEIYRNTHSIIENNFMHNHRTISHTEPDMTKTLQTLIKTMASKSPHLPNLGRSSTYAIPDLLDKGHELFEKATKGGIELDSTDDLLGGSPKAQ
ncbi:hypothetical protein BJ138DRAFT_1138408 [Hygrophoropsis aurantiaca]|uniref:Uncharacterized protein n=1 Tax=Hygrophoropsis aurantiaca TaxID=72124 RepID=A0ACB7ZW40_9AGAM|nr:hypothetical protein BJ138DRAFT_1138408 [Hygrophoropsis aurantiaca]